MGGGAPRSSCLGGEGYFLSGAQPTHRFVSSASDSESIPLKHHPHSTSKLDLGDHRYDHGSIRPRAPALTKNGPLLFLVTRFFFLETSSRFRWPKAARE